MEILKKIITTNNNKPILLQCDYSRNDYYPLSKLHQSCTTNYSNKNIFKTNINNTKKYDIKKKQ